MSAGDMISGIAAAAQATNDLGFGIYNAISQYRENQRNRDFAQQMAGYQNAVNRANWEAENRYNTPAMQLSRMRAAGINPALAMGGSQSLELAGSNMQGAAAVNASPQVAPQLSLSGSNIALSMAQAELARAQADNIRSKTPGEVKLQGAEYNKLLKDIEEADSRINLNAASISKMSTEEHEIMTRLAIDAARLEIDQDVAKAQMDLWNSQVGANEALRLKTYEEYQDLVAFRELRRKGLDLSNQEIQSRMHLNDAQINHLKAIDDDMNNRFEQEYGDTETAKLKSTLLKNQGDLAKRQAEYWTDYKANPKKYQARVRSVHKDDVKDGVLPGTKKGTYYYYDDE